MACRWRQVAVVQCEIWAEKPQFGFNDNIVCQVLAARQGFKQLNIRLIMAVSVWSPAACDPWLRWWPLPKLAHLSAALLILQGEACSFSTLCRWMSASPKLLGPLCFSWLLWQLPWHLNTAVAQRKAVIKLHDAFSLAMTQGPVYRRICMLHSPKLSQRLTQAITRTVQSCEVLTDAPVVIQVIPGVMSAWHNIAEGTPSAPILQVSQYISETSTTSCQPHVKHDVYNLSAQ